jgi:hypothetical protein
MIRAVIEAAMFSNAILVLFLLSVVSCTNASTPLHRQAVYSTALPLWNAPIPKPKYLYSLGSYTNGLGTRVCLSLNEFEIWEAGEFGQTYRRVSDTGIITVDDTIQADVEYSQYLNGINRFDKSNHVIGSHGGGIEVCFKIDALNAGFHVSRFSFKTKSGSMLEYTFAFKIVAGTAHSTKIKVDLPTLP